MLPSPSTILIWFGCGYVVYFGYCFVLTCIYLYSPKIGINKRRK